MVNKKLVVDIHAHVDWLMDAESEDEVVMRKMIDCEIQGLANNLTLAVELILSEMLLLTVK